MPGLNWCQLINFWCHLINIWGHVLLTIFSWHNLQHNLIWTQIMEGFWFWNGRHVIWTHLIWWSFPHKQMTSHSNLVVLPGMLISWPHLTQQQPDLQYHTIWTSIFLYRHIHTFIKISGISNSRKDILQKVLVIELIIQICFQIVSMCRLQKMEGLEIILFYLPKKPRSISSYLFNLVHRVHSSITSARLHLVNIPGLSCTFTVFPSYSRCICCVSAAVYLYW